jgi:hypothetical protein
MAQGINHEFKLIANLKKKKNETAAEVKLWVTC